MNRQEIRKVEKDSIRKFLQDAKLLFTGRTLDYGCGESPYKYLVSGEYVGYDPKYDSKREIPEGKFKTIICTQVLEYIVDPLNLLTAFYGLLEDGGYLVMTYPTHWEEVEPTDLHRFTKVGIERLLEAAGFGIISHTKRHSISFDDFELVIGYGVVAQKK